MIDNFVKHSPVLSDNDAFRLLDKVLIVSDVNVRKLSACNLHAAVELESIFCKILKDKHLLDIQRA